MHIETETDAFRANWLPLNFHMCHFRSSHLQLEPLDFSFPDSLLLPGRVQTLSSELRTAFHGVGNSPSSIFSPCLYEFPLCGSTALDLTVSFVLWIFLLCFLTEILLNTHLSLTKLKIINVKLI